MADSQVRAFLYGQRGKPVYGVKKYTIDDASGISKLPTDAHIGSSCLVLATGEVYTLNSQKEWIKLPNAGGSGSGSSIEEPEALTAEEIQAIIHEDDGGEN